jgi:hypothetical protein
MNKKDIMRHSSTETLLRAAIRHKPGITSARLFDLAKEWAGKSWEQGDTFEFEECLKKLRAGDFRVTNKQWYEKGHVSEREPHGPPKVDPRQIRMDW